MMRLPILLVVLLVLLHAPLGECQSNLIARTPRVKCYTCFGESKQGPCADPFRLVERKFFQRDCASGWCMKVEVGVSNLHTRDVGVGYIERKCMKYMMPDQAPRCDYMNYDGYDAYVCFCNGDYCNRSTSLHDLPFFIHVPTLLMLAFYYL